METRPSLWGRLLARIEGEVPADTLEAYRSGGAAVHRLLDTIQDRRLDLNVRGVGPWDAAPAEQAQLLCAWNAFALQTLGDQFLEADYRSNPATVGYVPLVTAQQALAFYEQVEPWLSRAHQAASNPGYRLDVPVPADLPPWTATEPCPVPHLDAIRAAVGALRTHAAAAAAVFPTSGLPPEQQATADRLRQLLAEAEGKLNYAQDLYAGPTTTAVHEQIERHLKDAAERYYQLGQMLAMPQLVTASADRSPRSTGRAAARLPGPGEPGFDIWCLTDPGTRATWERDPRARAAIALLWRSDPNPRRTLEIQAEIDAARDHGDVDYATTRTGQRLGSYYCCPWGPIYEVKRPITIGGRQLRPLQQFTFDVSAEGMSSGEPFRREIFVGAFTSTSNVDYCDPAEGGRRDH